MVTETCRSATLTCETLQQEHLKNFLGPFLDTLLECPGISYEINPSFLAAGENMGENRANLRTLVAKLVKLISGSATNLPKPLQLIWHLVRAVIRGASSWL